MTTNEMTEERLAEIDRMFPDNEGGTIWERSWGEVVGIAKEVVQDNRRLRAELAALTAEVERLKPYIGHQAGCSTRHRSLSGYLMECDCGLHPVLNPEPAS